MAVVISADGGTPPHPIVQKLLSFRKMALLIAFAGAYYYSQWSFDPRNMEVTRISEHSLMPGLVTPKFEKSGAAIQMYRQLGELKKPKTQQQYLHDKFAEFGLQSYSQKWESRVKSVKQSGENVYGFVRGQRNDGAEAQLVVVQLGKSEKARRMIARMLAFIDFAREQVFWARDFVFVFVDGGAKETTEQAALALDAFLLKYQKLERMMSVRGVAVTADEVQSQTGALIAGVVYDLSGMSVRHTHVVNLLTNGLNGQQVNLDVFNGIVKIADSKHAAKVALYGSLHRHTASYQDVSPFQVPLRAVYTQAFTAVEGLHSVMGKYGVQGLTVGLSYDFSERQTGQFIEEVSRMLNNVLERLHQSYFMYVLADDMHFASVGFYIPVIGILLTPLLISAYYEWTTMSSFVMPFRFLTLHLLGFVIYAASTWIFANVGPQFVFQWTSFPFLGADGSDGQLTPSIPLIPVLVLVLATPVGLFSFWKWPVRSVGTVRMLCLLETSLILGSLSLLNFGLAVLSAAVVVPIVFMMTFESTQKARSLVRTGVLAILSPIGVLAFLAQQAPEFFGVANSFAHLTDFALAARLVHNLVEQHVVFGSHHFFIICVAAYPIWNLLFAGAMHWDLEDEEEEEEQQPKKPTKKQKSKK